MDLKGSVLGKSVDAFYQRGDVLLRYKVRLCVPNIDVFREQIQEESHGLGYSINLGSVKMYRALFKVY